MNPIRSTSIQTLHFHRRKGIIHLFSVHNCKNIYVLSEFAKIFTFSLSRSMHPNHSSRRMKCLMFTIQQSPFCRENEGNSKGGLEQSRGLWMSDDKEEDILDRFLKVQEFKEMRLPSMDSKCALLNRSLDSRYFLTSMAKVEVNIKV